MVVAAPVRRSPEGRSLEDLRLKLPQREAREKAGPTLNMINGLLTVEMGDALGIVEDGG